MAKKLKLYSVTLAFLIVLGGFAFALPNLKLNWVKFFPENGRLVAEVYNDSNETVDHFSANFYADGRHIGSYNPEAVTLGPNSTISISTGFPDDGETHSFFVLLDPENQVNEENENDNSAADEKPTAQERQLDNDKGSDNGRTGGLLEQPTFLIITAVSAIVIIIFIFVLVKGLRKK